MKQFSFILLILLCFHVSYPQSESTFSILFEFNKYKLSVLDTKKIQTEFSNKNYLIKKISGFADTTGNMIYNKGLSGKRASSVYDFLFAKGFVRSNVAVSSYGEEKSGNQDPQFDRRVEIIFEIPAPVQTVAIDSVQTPEVYELPNIYFKPDLAVIEPFSLINVEETVRYLKNLHDCRFEIVGHVNAVLSEKTMEDPNALLPFQKLSEERARKIYELLAEYGIPANVMSYRGVGNTQMLFKHPKYEEEMRKNMRVEILIFCNKFP